MTWTKIPAPAAARDIAIGRDGIVWVVGTNPVPGGYGVFRYDGTNWPEQDHGIGAVRITVDHDGMPWTVDDANQIKRLTSSGWQTMPGQARDIGAGAEGSVWIIGTNPIGNGFGLWQFDGSAWQPMDGSGVHIAVGPKGEPWVVNGNHQIQQRIDTNHWETLPGTATDITVSAHGLAWTTGRVAYTYGYAIRWWAGTDWAELEDGSQGVQIAIDATDNPWVVNNRNEIWQGSGIYPT